MTLDEITAAIRDLTDDDFNRLSDEMFTMRREREARPQVEQSQANLITELQDAGKLDKPKAMTEEQAASNPTAVPAWVDPGTDHAKMYHQGDVVRYGDKFVRSTHPGLNHWAPGTLAFDGRIWEIIGTVEETTPERDADQDAGETAPEPEVPEYKQPSGGHDAYKIGDRVRFNGALYESVIDANVWSPDAYPQGWRKL